MDFFLDANLPRTAKDVFKKFNLGVVHASDVDLAEAPDRIIFDFAVKHKQILVTKDLDFANTQLYPLGTHCGIIVLRLPSYFTATQIKNALMNFLKEINLKDIAGAITILETGKYRIRTPGKD